ncbi:Trehalose-6-P synthase/phosphatase complex synthase subunit [Lecanora helva]
MPSLDTLSAPGPRLLLVSNRLPVAVKRSGPNDYTFTQGSGGLVSGLAGLSKSTEFQWYGWPGLEIPETETGHLSNRLRDEYGVVPVYLSDSLGDLYYNGFANSILWPLIHYHPGEVTFSEEAWEAYQEANRKFAKVIARDVQDGDLIWIHDYHLMLLPAMLREEIDSELNVKIGFFMHTPFPSSEIYRILPVRNEILLGVLHSDLVGFHTNSYARHFLSSCSIVLGLPTTIRNVVFQGRVVTIGAFPIGIQPERFTETLAETPVQERIASLEQDFKGKSVMVGVDRLDYMKGVPQKLRAFEFFLSEYPEYVGKVILIQVAIPTRGEVEEYQNLRALVNEQIGRINGRFGTIEYTPIHFIHKSVAFPELLALYAVSDACIVASTRDGMNLVSFEYIACQQKRHGSMILSEFAGSAQSLDGSLIVNPWNIFEMARAMHQAVTMGEEERLQRFEQMNAYVQNNTSAFWGKSFVKELKRVGEEPERTKRFGQDLPPIRIDWRSYDGPSCCM